MKPGHILVEFRPFLVLNRDLEARWYNLKEAMENDYSKKARRRMKSSISPKNGLMEVKSERQRIAMPF
jgi:hypothetical protein